MKLEKQYQAGYEAEVNELDDCFVISVTAEKGITHNCHIPKNNFFEMIVKAIRGELKIEKSLENVSDCTTELTKEDIEKFIETEGTVLENLCGMLLYEGEKCTICGEAITKNTPWYSYKPWMHGWQHQKCIDENMKKYERGIKK